MTSETITTCDICGIKDANFGKVGAWHTFDYFKWSDIDTKHDYISDDICPDCGKHVIDFIAKMKEAKVK
jgi:hypothetical protein